MSEPIQRDRAWLLATAKTVSLELKSRTAGLDFQNRFPKDARSTDTRGWAAVIGRQRSRPLWVEVWLDHYSAHDDRKLWVGFWCADGKFMDRLTRKVSRELWPIRTITDADIVGEKHYSLAERLPRSQFHAPILEKYQGRNGSFFGFYDQTRPTAEPVNTHFCLRAVAFLEDVVRSLEKDKEPDGNRETYPQIENRKIVVSHLRRERSRLLAMDCKLRDKFECQVCGLRFVDRYGPLGHEFAEAHHLVPLNQLEENVLTRLDDLATVCANCHRMLHRMAGERDDLAKLRAIVRRQASS